MSKIITLPNNKNKKEKKKKKEKKEKKTTKKRKMSIYFVITRHSNNVDSEYSQSVNIPSFWL